MSSNEERVRPNCFMAIQIRNPVIHKNIVDCQNKAICSNKVLEKHVESVRKAHLTLCVLRIEWHQIEEAKAVIAEAFESKLKDLNGTQLGFNGGLDYFKGGKVVWVKPTSGLSELQRISAILKESLDSAGFNVLEKDRDFQPHLTIFKYSYEKARRGPEGRKEMKDSHLHFTGYQDFEFGSETITSIQFLCMESPIGEDGYYHKHHEVFFPENKIDTDYSDHSGCCFKDFVDSGEVN